MVKRIIGVGLRVVVLFMVAVLVGQVLFNGSLFPAAGTSHIKQQEKDISYVGTGRHLNTGNQITSIATSSLGFNASNSSLTRSKLPAQESITGSRLQADGVKTPEKQGIPNNPTSSDIPTASDTASIELPSKGIPVVTLNATGGNLSLTPSSTDVISLDLEKNNSIGAEVGPDEERDELPACQIRVCNQVEYHYEVIESAAKLMPYEYLNLPDTCNHQHLHFHFDQAETNHPRAKPFLEYMNDRVFNTSIVDETTGITRSFGKATMKQLDYRSTWDTTIQVTCRCREDRPWLLDGSFGPRLCIYHGKCFLMDNLPNMIQLSPHHERYFIPSALPHYGINFAKRKDDKKVEICSIGEIRRRNWNLMVPFLKEAKNEVYFDKIRIRMLGGGEFPYQLRAYTNRTEIYPEVIFDDREFYATVAVCDILIMAVDSKLGKDYFKSVPGSKWKLSGTIPPVIAFERPFVIPEELVELYKAHLPLEVPHRGYDHKNGASFSEALSSLLEEMLGTESTPPNASGNASSTLSATDAISFDMEKNNET